jgi:hypothetical protein
MFIKLPFRLSRGHIECEQDIKSSVDQFMELLVSSACGSFVPDENFGFVFRNFKFENIDDFLGTIMKSRENPSKKDHFAYGKKIIGSSNNANTFASELKKSIEKYEQRLKNVSVRMDYEKKQKFITVEVKGQLNNDRPTDYEHKILFHIW